MGDGVIQLVYDEGPGVGLGHRRRMSALATALGEMELEALLTPLTDGAGVEADVAFVDSYRVRADDRRRIDARWVGAVDDLERGLDVDLVVDPAGEVRVGGRDAPRASSVLEGLRYALLDPALSTLEPHPVRDSVETVMVAAGGADGEGLGASIAAIVQRALPDAAVRLAVGPWGVPDVPDGVEPVITTDGLGHDLAGADLVVTAAGVTLLEAVALGRPAVGFAVAPNQRRSLVALVAAGAVVGATLSEAAESAVDLARDPARRASLVRRGPEVVDGRGSARVANAVAGLL